MLEDANEELQKVKLQHATFSAELREQAAQAQQNLQAQHESEKRELTRSSGAKEAHLSHQVMWTEGEKLYARARVCIFRCACISTTVRVRCM